MKKFSTLAFALFVAGAVFGQSASKVASPERIKEKASYDVKLNQLSRTDESLVTAKRIAPSATAVTPAPRGVQGAVNPIELGRASNAFTILRQEQNQVTVNNELNLVAFIHRQDVTIFGGGGTENGKLRYDLSIDDGATFTKDIGVMNATYTLRTRYPNIAGYNPANNTNPFDSKLVWGAPTLSPGTAWDGHAYGVSDVNTGSSTSTENYEFGGGRTLLPGGLIEGAAGEFWSVDVQYDGSATQDSLYIYKGTWNSGTGDVDWARNLALDPGHDKTYDGTVRVVGPNVAFSPDGSTGWVAWIGDLTGGNTNSHFSPIVMKTTDGGANWSTPQEVMLDSIPWIRDSLQSFWTDSLGNPASDGDATLAFDFDVTVDANNNLHLAAVCGTGADGYSISSGLSKFIVDIWTPDGGATWNAEYIGAVATFRGEFGTPDPNDGSLLTIDNCVQVARNDAGDRVFYSWVDSDTSIVGFGEVNNLAPNLRVTGLRLSDLAHSPVYKVTDGDIIWDGRILTPTMGPVVVEAGTGFGLPIVALDMITNDQLAPCKFWYYGNDAFICEDQFAAGQDLTTNGFIDPPATNCVVGIEEEIDANGVKHLMFPNPANDQVTLRFDMPQSAQVELSILNMMGQTVYNSAVRTYNAGLNDIEVNTSNLTPGVYFYNLVINEETYTRKLVINR